MDALRCRRRRRGRASSRAARGAASRCARCCCRSPTCCCSTSPPTTSTPSPWRGSSSTSREYPGTVVAVTHDRYFLDNVAEWILELDRGEGYPVQGQLLALARAEAARGWRRRRSRRARVSASWSASSSGCARRRARVRPRARRACSAYESCCNDQARAEARPERDLHPARAAPRRPGDRGRGRCKKAFGDKLLVDGPELHSCRAAASSASSARTAPARPRCSA